MRSWKRGDPVVLFNGHDLAGWQAVPPAHLMGWLVKDGVMIALPGAPDLISDKKFANFVVDAEYRIEPHTNSGIGLRGRYEVQITDDVGPSVIQSRNGRDSWPHRAYVERGKIAGRVADAGDSSGGPRGDGGVERHSRH